MTRNRTHKWLRLLYAPLAALAMTLAATPAFAQETAPKPPPVLDDESLMRKYVWSTLGTEGALHATLMSGWEQWRDSPDSWDQNTAGYAQRWVSDYAASAIGSTTKYVVARALHHDPSFTRCECVGVQPRLRHALVAPFTARTRTGRRVLSPAIVAGLAAENIIPSATWYPAANGTRDGITHAVSSVVTKMVVDVFREFVSLKKKPHIG